MTLQKWREREGPAGTVQEAGGGVQEEDQQKQSVNEKGTMKRITLFVKS